MNQQKNKSLRCFIGVFPNDETKQELSALLKTLKDEVALKHLRWLPLENLHITLRFLGITTEEIIKALITELTQAFKTTQAFTMTLENLHYFPSNRKPHVLALAINPQDQLKQLSKQTEEIITQHEFEPEKRDFNAHLTLARLKNNKPHKLPPLKNTIQIPFNVNTVSLIHSQTLDSGVNYTTLHRWDLAR